MQYVCATTTGNMEIQQTDLQIKRSGITGAGKGLFTKVFIPKNTIITEYKGKITTWNDADHDDGKNGYIFYLTRNHVIDAKADPEALAHYANDARGLTKVKGMNNNAQYTTKGKRVFIESTHDIREGEEILVGYGKDYWDTVKKNSLT